MRDGQQRRAGFAREPAQLLPVRGSATHLALLEDHLDLVVREGVLEAVTEKDDKGQALAKLVRAGRRARGVAAGQFVLGFAIEDG